MKEKEGELLNVLKIDYLDFSGIMFRSNNLIYMKKPNKIEKGHHIILREYDKEFNEYSGKSLRVVVVEINQEPKQFKNRDMMEMKVVVI